MTGWISQIQFMWSWSKQQPKLLSQKNQPTLLCPGLFPPNCIVSLRIKKVEPSLKALGFTIQKNLSAKDPKAFPKTFWTVGNIQKCNFNFPKGLLERESTFNFTSSVMFCYKSLSSKSSPHICVPGMSDIYK